MSSKTQPVFEQISLFDDAYTLFNSGLADLMALNLKTARDSFERYGEIYRARDQVADFLKVVDFLEKKLAQIPDSDEKPACLYDLLKNFEAEAEAETVSCLSKDIRDGIRSSFQCRILQAIEDYRLCDAPYLSNAVPTGYVYLQAGRPAEAIRALQACLPLSPRNSLIYGYLGDAYAMRNEVAQARQCYLNACLNDPKAVDWNFLQDSELVSLKNRLVDRYGNESLALEWLPVHASGSFQTEFTGFLRRVEGTGGRLSRLAEEIPTGPGTRTQGQTVSSRSSSVQPGSTSEIYKNREFY